MGSSVRKIPGNLPKTDREWWDFKRLLEIYIYERLQDIPGRLDLESKLPMVMTGNRSSAQVSIPLSAEDAGSDASIMVAAHTVQHGSLSITYGAATLTGYAYGTTYFVYGDNPTYTSGVNTYSASTSYIDAVSGDGRYYVGEVTTPTAAAPPTTGTGGASSGTSGGGIWP